MKVTCPRCGQPGYLTRVKVYGKYYMRVEHVENGKKRICYLGRDAEALRQYIESALGSGNAYKVIRFAGGDYKIADILRPRLERLCPKRCTFVEVFGGSGYMSQTVSRSVYNNIIYNDVNNLLVNLYKHIKEDPEALAMVLSMLPYSRSYHMIISQLVRECKEFASLAVAAMVFYIYNTSFVATLTNGGFGYAKHPGRNQAKEYKARVLAVLRYAATWRDVVFESLDFREIIKKYDSELTVFYLDPPYVDRAEEYYGTSFTVEDLREMATLLTQIRGRFLLKVDKKTYELISDILPGDRYNVEVFERKLNMQRVRGTQRGTWTLVLVSSR
jgi:DNA adenine methylase